MRSGAKAATPAQRAAAAAAAQEQRSKAEVAARREAAAAAAEARMKAMQLQASAQQLHLGHAAASSRWNILASKQASFAAHGQPLCQQVSRAFRMHGLSPALCIPQVAQARHEWNQICRLQSCND